MEAYVIGLDFGTLSVRGVLSRTSDGTVLTSVESAYANGVMEHPQHRPGWALQNPSDYLISMQTVISAIVKESGVPKDAIIGIGVDFTASTTVLCKADGTPLCTLPQYRNDPHAFAKLWKHHGAQPQAEALTALADRIDPTLLSRYGGCFNSEWPLPRMLELWEEAPEILSATDLWLEAGDWIVMMLTGIPSRNLSAAAAKYHYCRETDSCLTSEFLNALPEAVRDVLLHKLGPKPVPNGSRVGFLRKEIADRLGLSQNTAVAAANMDGHAPAPAIGMRRPGQILGVIGTSAGCFALSPGSDPLPVPGICGAIPDAMWPDMVCYEAGQSCVGDMFSWFVKNAVPEKTKEEAAAAGIDLYTHLTRQASELAPGESGLIALDWFNGNRSILADAKLSGTILGLTLNTKPQEIFRALLEAAAFGARILVDNYRSHGLSAEEFLVSGGIGRKNPLAMQIYADVLNLPVFVSGASQGPAQGSAIFAAVAAGKAAGGYESLSDASDAMGSPYSASYAPIPAHTAVYEDLFREFKTLHDYFGRGENDVMKHLLALRTDAKEK